jgi:hypothetical protein
MSIEQKISELLAESKKLKESADEATVSEEVKEMGTNPDNSGKVKGNAAAGSVDPTPSITTDGVTTIGGEEESNAKNAKQTQKDAEEAKKSNNVANAKATAPEASHLSSVKEDIDALMNGEELSEEFKTKATTIFEAAVLSRVKVEAAKLEEQYESKLQEEVETIKEGLVEKVDGYLGYVVEQWVQENELALESGMKSEIMESFIEGMKSLFAEHYIDVPEEKFDVMSDLAEKVEALEAKLDEQVAKNVEMSKEINEQKRVASIEETSAGLTDTESEKFKALAEELAYEDQDSFATKLQTIRENYFAGKKVISEVTSVVTDTPVETLTETAPVDPSIKKYLAALDNLK